VRTFQEENAVEMGWTSLIFITFIANVVPECLFTALNILLKLPSPISSVHVKSVSLGRTGIAVSKTNSFSNISMSCPENPQFLIASRKLECASFKSRISICLKIRPGRYKRLVLYVPEL